LALSMAFIGDIVPKEKNGSAMGLLGTMSAVGTALGPTLGGLLIAGLGWQALFYINVPLGIFAWMLVRHAMPVDHPTSRINRQGLDYPGTILLALTLAAFALAMTLGRGSFGYLNVILLITSAAGAGVFVFAQAHCASPLVQLTIFRTPELGARLAMNILVTTVVMATLIVGPFYLAGALTLDAVRIGLIMSSGPIVAALLGVPSGGFVDRFGAQRMTMAGLIGMTIGCALIAMLPVRCGIPGYVGALAIITAGYAFFQTANNTAVMAGIEPHQRGVVSGLLSLSRNLGLITGASLMGAVFAWEQARSNASVTSKAVEAGMQTTFALAAILVAVGLGIALRSRRG
jgi:MFS family permease